MESLICALILVFATAFIFGGMLIFGEAILKLVMHFSPRVRAWFDNLPDWEEE